MYAILSTAPRLAARNAQYSRPDRHTVLSCTAVGPLQFVVDGVALGRSLPTAAALLCDRHCCTVAIRSGPTFETHCCPRNSVGDMFCAQIPSAGSGDTLNCMRAL